jgi:predicted dehydrogenase
VDLTVIDPNLGIGTDQDLELCSHVFVATPASTHFDLVKNLLNRKKEVFCEKPLTFKTEEVDELYRIADRQNCSLFVDWTFLFNEAVNNLKRKIDNRDFGEIISVSAKRLNKGPQRTDASARWDLASHDLSIILHLFDKSPINTSWFDFYRSKDSQVSDTCVGILKFDNFDAIIEASWEHPIKDRTWKFAFSNGILHWDDATGSSTFNGEEINFEPSATPLSNAVESFLYQKFNTKKITKQITKILEWNQN